MGKTLFVEDYEIEFIAGVLANICAEGNVGLFEGSYYSDPAREPWYLKLMDDLHNYRKEYSYKNITDVSLSEVYSLLEELEADAWQKGKFGLGAVQWTGSRTKTLVEMYIQESGGQDRITKEQAIKAEANMIVYELAGSFSDVYRDWKKLQSDNTTPTEAAGNAGYIVSRQYERPRGGETAALYRKELAVKIYEAMTKQK